jgi:hypothetical protein
MSHSQASVKGDPPSNLVLQVSKSAITNLDSPHIWPKMAETFSDTDFGGHLQILPGQMRKCAYQEVMVISWRREEVIARDAEPQMIGGAEHHESATCTG